ncbi:GDSL esterase/lipase [Rhynchospora pubera]|uniref:GDSL esterase/lipase n=1 Tax=Rhynchospora pubera TaxID=906938 RepID=A0AAV8GVC4_9POAL|nr:GDSL esterase/lipase [Rhynchospora pubera]
MKMAPMPLPLFFFFVFLFPSLFSLQANSQLSELSTPPSLPSPLAPALFVIGDSTVDSGTNNHLLTLARADHPPYGRDFDTGRPTGRFSNGRLVVDYLALRLGLPFVPPYLGLNGKVEELVQGVNYASAGAGVIFASGSNLGMHLSLKRQMQQVSDTYERLELGLGEVAAADLFTKSVFYISIGTNDFTHYYFRNTTNIRSLYLPWEFNQLLVETIQHELKNLYNLNVRKVIIMGVAPIGCSPHYLWEYNSVYGECVEQINNMIVQLNFAMTYMVHKLNMELDGAMFTFCDAFEGSLDILKNRDRYGFVSTTDACCGMGKYGGRVMCLFPEMACRNATNHVWWDQYHPTDAVNRILADNVWSGKHAEMCYPMNLLNMTTHKT